MGAGGEKQETAPPLFQPGGAVKRWIYAKSCDTLFSNKRATNRDCFNMS